MTYVMKTTRQCIAYINKRLIELEQDQLIRCNPIEAKVLENSGDAKFWSRVND